MHLSKSSCDSVYEQKMILARENFFRSLEISKMDGFVICENGLQSRIWEQIKNCFDQVHYQGLQNNAFPRIKNDLKHAFVQLLECGLPFVDGREVVIWSTRFAYSEAEKYAALHGKVTDSIAQKELRKVVLGYPDGRLNILYPLVNPSAPIYPDLIQLFWGAITELFIEQVPENAIIHFFFQDALTVGNISWNYELPVARQKNAKIFLHRYNTDERRWEKPVLFDSPEAASIPIRRRKVHPDDRYSVSDVEVKGDQLLWKQATHENKPDGRLTDWTAPRILTLGKLRNIAQTWRARACSG